MGKNMAIIIFIPENAIIILHAFLRLIVHRLIKISTHVIITQMGLKLLLSLSCRSVNYAFTNVFSVAIYSSERCQLKIEVN